MHSTKVSWIINGSKLEFGFLFGLSWLPSLMMILFCAAVLMLSLENGIIPENMTAEYLCIVTKAYCYLT